LNNGAFFAFATHLFAVHHPGAFWMFAIGFGTTLLGLAAASAKWNPEQRSMDGSYLAQGLILVTVGLLMRVPGPQLAVTLALESAVLLYGMRLRHRALYELAAGLCALGAFGFAALNISHGRSVGITTSLLLGSSAWLVKYLTNELDTVTISPRALFYSVLAMGVIGLDLWKHVPTDWLSVSLVLVAMLGLPAFRIRMGELGLISQSFVPLAALSLIAQSAAQHPAPSWGFLSVVVGATVFTHWWQFFGSRISPTLAPLGEWFFATAATFIGLIWTHTHYQGESWLIVSSIIAVGTLSYGLVTRSAAIAVTGQIFGVSGSASMISMIIGGDSHSLPALAPVLSIALSSVLIGRLGRNRWPCIA
jgi:hypothetical protein